MEPDLVLLTTSEVAAKLRVAETTVRRWVREGVIPAVPVPGRNMRFRKADLDAWLSGDSKPPEGVG